MFQCGALRGCNNGLCSIMHEPHYKRFIADHSELEPFSCLHSTLYYYWTLKCTLRDIMCGHMTTFQVRDWL